MKLTFGVRALPWQLLCSALQLCDGDGTGRRFPAETNNIQIINYLCF